MERKNMTKEQAHMNRLWWMASAVVLLFVALAVVPVAAETNDWNKDGYVLIPGVSYYNYTLFDTVNEEHFTAFPLTEKQNKVNLTMTNGTGGMNAVHISTYGTNNAGQCFVSKNLTDTLYVTNTGGRNYQDNVILLIGLASNNDDERQNLAVDIDAKGYSWEPKNTANSGPAQEDIQWTGTEATVTSDDYVYDDEGGVYQIWKFAPNPNYPMYCGQDMTSTSKINVFNLTAVDLWEGILSNTTMTGLNNSGTIKVNYTIYRKDGLSVGIGGNSTRVALNVYAYNRYTSQGWNQTLWLNRVNKAGESTSGCSGFSYYSAA
jgi:hypothetical protein